MPGTKLAASKRPRGRYSRLICLGCRDRRIRCELPSGVEIPNPGELRTIQSPCYRCKRLNLPCVIRQTTLGRADYETRLTDSTKTNDKLFPRQGDQTLWHGDTLLLHHPQSPEHVFIVRALDTLRCERVEEEWFRHLPAYAGHTRALDLSIQAIVTACAYSRGVPKVTSTDCYNALALALDGLRTHIRQQQHDDDMLASTALLLPFEGVIQKNGIPTPLHINGLAAILAARSPTSQVSELAREIVDFHVCEAAMLACLQGLPSSFESVAQPYLANVKIGSDSNDRARLKALGNELFIRVPRLVALMRELRHGEQSLDEALQLTNTLLQLQDREAEGRLLRTTELRPSKTSDSHAPFRESLQFASVKDFEALATYWQNRLLLLRLELRLHDLSVCSDIRQIHKSSLFPQPTLDRKTNEISRLVNNLLLCLEYAAMLPLRRHDRLVLHAIVVVWGVLKDMPDTLNHDSQDGGLLFDVLLRRVNISLAAKPKLTAKDLDTVADTFAGGQLKGRFTELHGLY